ncbi:unnamed protein product [Phyllotreta striolata]|uniref:Uncharacterized protein n=1 Tax=Phyllotreta striolata TaxID=444603 RepID=A0A9N9XQH1_PHYSR|nr:unnamed protein product [Phyllotreta striolata]
MAFKVVFGATAAFVLFFNSLPIAVASPVATRQLLLPDLNVGFPPNVTLLIENLNKYITETLGGTTNSNDIDDLLQTVTNTVNGLLEGLTPEGGSDNIFEEIAELVSNILNGGLLNTAAVQSRQLVEGTTTPSVDSSNGLTDLLEEIGEFVSAIIGLATGTPVVQARQLDASAITAGIDLLSSSLGLMKQTLDASKPFVDTLNTVVQNIPLN